MMEPMVFILPSKRPTAIRLTIEIKNNDRVYLHGMLANKLVMNQH